MKTVYLHIGTHKTGTTTLQHFLSRASTALKDQGVLYPEAGRSSRLPYAHYNLAWAVRKMRGVTSTNAWSEVLSEIEDWDGEGAVLSSEDFWPCTSEEIQEITRFLADQRVEVILYVRNPVDYILSCYKQHLLSAGHKSLEVYMAESVDRVDYLSAATSWKSDPGVDALHIRPFDKVKGTKFGLERDFIDRVGLDFEPLRRFGGPSVNVSPADDVLQVVRLVSRVEDLLTRRIGREREVAAIAKRLRRQLYDQTWIGGLLTRALRPFLYDDIKEAASPETWDWFRGEIVDQHRAFLQKFVDAEDRKYLELRRAYPA